MPALANSKVGSSKGTTLDEWTKEWRCSFWKYSKNVFLTWTPKEYNALRSAVRADRSPEQSDSQFGLTLSAGQWPKGLSDMLLVARMVVGRRWQGVGGVVGVVEWSVGLSLAVDCTGNSSLMLKLALIRITLLSTLDLTSSRCTHPVLLLSMRMKGIVPK